MSGPFPGANGAPGKMLACVLVSAFAFRAFGLGASYPEVRELSLSDVLFRQLSDTIELGYRAERSGKAFPDLFFLSYTVPEDTDLFSLAARVALPYETIATANALGGAFGIRKGTRLVLPSLAGVFVPVEPVRDFDFLLASSRSGSDDPSWGIAVDLPGGRRENRFFPGSRFNSTERSFFLNVQFRFPLPAAILTSSYGFRESPFGGKRGKHEGVDLAAPAGTEVFAARGGTVTAAGIDSTLGNYVVISHEGGWTTVYGHLLRVSVQLNQKVLSGTIVGAVGSTGLSTGPHLHFEIRIQGAARDPATLIPRITR